MSNRTFASFLLLAHFAALTGCTGNQYATPRTIPRGTVSHTVALEGSLDFGFNGEPGDLHPRYQLRIGAADRVDIGIMVGPYLGADVKLNFLRTKHVDMAWSPGVHYGLFPLSNYGFGEDFTQIVRFSAPLSLGFNTSKTVSLFVHANVAVLADVSDDEVYGCPPPYCEKDIWSVVPEVGLGVQVRLTPNIALTPELTVYGDSTYTSMPGIHGGIAITFGAQPNYDDFDEKKSD